MHNLSNRALIFGLITIYALIRVASFLTYGETGAQEIISIILATIFVFFCIKNISWAWTILIGEILLDGAGHFFELKSLILRIWFLGIFTIIWLIQKISAREKLNLPPKNVLIGMVTFGLFLFYAIANGLALRHSPIFIAQDAILYLFILLIFPAFDFKKYFLTPYSVIVKTFIVGSVIFSLVTLFLYSSGLAILTDPYYHWFRNIAAGKITDLGQNFFRIVLPEHLFIIPIILVVAACLMRQPKKPSLWILMICAIIILALNFTRIYILAMIVGLVVLFYRENFKKWFAVSVVALISLLIIFCSLHLVASRGQSLGLELLGVRMTGIQTPVSDPSGAIRLALLPDIFRTIKNNPLLGSGLGTTVTYVDPATKETQTRTQFDWGYLEMIAELGIIGTLAYLSLLVIIILNLFRATYSIDAEKNLQPLRRGLFAGAIALFFINITTPALFQGFGVIYFVLLILASDVSAKLSPAPPRIS
ncbi:MAG: O-antigen ligase family protein [Candidatus Magasanikbacteria bacterium]